MMRALAMTGMFNAFVAGWNAQCALQGGQFWGVYVALSAVNFACVLACIWRMY
jgi:hypothetical protein